MDCGGGFGFGRKSVDRQVTAFVGVIAHIADIDRTVGTSGQILPVHVLGIGYFDGGQEVSFQVHFVEFGLAATVIIGQQRAAFRIVGQTGTFVGNRRKPAYFANFVAGTSLVKAIFALIRSAATQSHF